MARWEDQILIGTRADQPDADTVPEGTLYAVTDESLIERSNAVTWDLYGASGSGGGGSGPALSAGTQLASTGTVVFSDSNGVTFGMAGSTRVTASIDRSVSLYAVGNTTQSSTGTAPASSIQFRGAGIASVGVTGGSVVVSVPAGGASMNFSAGTTSNDLAAVVFSNSNGVSFGLNGSTITGSVATSLTNLRISAGTTSNLLSAVTFSNANGVSFGLNASTITATVKTDYLTTAMASNRGSDFVAATAAFAGTNASGTIASNGISVSVAAPGAANINISAGTTSNNLTALTFSNANGVSFGLDGSTLTATVQTNYLTTAALSGDTTKYVQAWELTGNTSGTTSSLQGTKIYFQGGNSLTVSGSSNTVVFSVGNYLTTAMASNRGSDFVAATAGFNGTNASGTLASNSWSVSVAAQTNQTIGAYMSSNTTSSVSSGTLDARSMTFRGAGVASVGYSAGEVVISVPAGGGGITNINVSAGTTSQNLSNFVLSNSNNVSFGLNGSTITATASGPVTLSTYDVVSPYGQSTNVVSWNGSNNSAVQVISLMPFVLPEYVSVGVLNIYGSMNFSVNGANSGRQSAGMRMGLFTLNASTLSLLLSRSFSWGVTYNNSSISVNQPTSTDYTGYATGDTNSAGSNISSGYTGGKIIGWPINSLLTPGNYWLGMFATNITSSNSVGVLFSFMGAVVNTLQTALAPMGSYSSDYTTGMSPYGGRWNQMGVWTTNAPNATTAMPGTIDLANVYASAMSLVPVVRLWST